MQRIRFLDINNYPFEYNYGVKYKLIDFHIIGSFQFYINQMNAGMF